ncbi:MAG: hypothetical protein JSS27_15345 [Planctomycetes bacterium]|nr:hypothetical protein [Planctomycetota bacterium]
MLLGWFRRRAAGPLGGRLALVGGCLVALVVAGCGQAEFEARLNQQVEIVNHADKFRGLYPQYRRLMAADGSLPIWFRIPAKFNSAWENTPATPDPDTNAPPIRNETVQPDFVWLPDVRLYCQGTAKDGRGIEVPFFLHIAAKNIGGSTDPNAPQPDPNAPPAQDPNAQAVNPTAPTLPNTAPSDPNAVPPDPNAPPDPAAVEAAARAAKAKELSLDPNVPLREALLARLNKAFPELKAEKFDEAVLEAPAKGNSVQWQTLKINAESFYRKMGLHESSGFKLPGTIWVNYFEGQGWRIVAIMRIPESIQRQADMKGCEDWMKRMCGTLTIGERAPQQ